jgi:hypothetical protein
MYCSTTLVFGPEVSLENADREWAHLSNDAARTHRRGAAGNVIHGDSPPRSKAKCNVIISQGVAVVQRGVTV